MQLFAFRVGVGLAAAALSVWSAPTWAETCFHPQGSVEFGLKGDLNQSGAVNVADALCSIKCVQAATANPSAPLWPACLTAPPVLADGDCNDSVTVGDVQALVHHALELELPSDVDHSGDGCPDACSPCPSGASGAEAQCEWADPIAGRTITSSDGGASLDIPPGALSDPTIIEIAHVPVPPVEAERVSEVYDFGPDGLSFDTPATVCLQTSPPPPGGDNRCLSYIDTSVNPPEWKCQDPCLTQISPSFWCGHTNHFTSFAVLLNGSGASGSCTSQPMGSAGGTLVSADGGASITLPANALSALTLMVVAHVPTPLVETQRISEVYDFGPDGLSFAAPAKICLHADPPSAGSENRCLGYIDTTTASPEWKCQDACLDEDESSGELCGTTDHLTSFAILLNGSGASGACSAETIGPEGGTLSSPDGGATIDVPAGALSAPATIRVAHVPVPLVEAQRVSEVYDFGPNDLSFATPATICLQADPPAGADRCLGYIDTTTTPPEWKCQDSCLTQISPSFWCGKTTHFTSFAVLLGSSSSSGGCGGP